MPRKGPKGEEVKNNAIKLVTALLLLADEELELEKRVLAEWDTSGKKLQVTGKKIYNNINVTTLPDLVQLVEKLGNSLSKQKECCTEQRKKEAVRDVIHHLIRLDMLEDQSPGVKTQKRKNTPYWKFKLTLKHQTAGLEDNLRYLEARWENDRDRPQLEPLPSTSVTPAWERRFRKWGGLSEKQPASYKTELLPHPDYSLLFDLLLKIDFHQQRQLVKQAISMHRTAGFLLYGDSDCGQQFLVNRLFRLKQGWQNKSPIKIDVSANSTGRRISNLWGRLCDWFSLSRDAKPRQVLEKTCDRLLAQDVIFIFDSVDYMLPGGLLAAWLEDFWVPLVKMAEGLPQRETHLLMFLVDNCGRVGQSNLMLAEKIDQPEYPYLPLRLPPACKFPLEALEDWFDDVREYTYFQIPTTLTPQELLEKSGNGIPQFVYEEICQQYGVSLEGVITQWLI